MLTLKLRKTGNSYVVTIPREELERQNLREGDMVGIEVRKLNVMPEMSPEFRTAFDQTLKTFKADIDYLANK